MCSTVIFITWYPVLIAVSKSKSPSPGGASGHYETTRPGQRQRGDETPPDRSGQSGPHDKDPGRGAAGAELSALQAHL